MKNFTRYLLALTLITAVFGLSGCVTGNLYSGWTMSGSQQSTSPASQPGIAWQTTGQRQTLSNESAAAQRPGLQTMADQAVPPRKIKAAILLPLSGKQANLGQSMLKAAQMALFDVGSGNFELEPIDTKSTPEGALAAAQSAIAKGDEIILGPVFADDAKAVKPVAQAARVPMIAFTTDWTVAGGGAYVMGFMPFAQVARVVSYAKAKGYDRFAAYAPQTEYCDVVIQALYQAGVNTVKTGRYAPSQPDLSVLVKDFADQTQQMAGTENQKRAFSFNALLLPVGGEGLRSLVSTLDAAGITNDSVKFIGTGLWDDESLVQNPALYGGWFAAPDPALRRDFEKRYQENYGVSPLRVSSLAYDATALAAVLARAGGDHPYGADRLGNPRGFAGIDGIFRFRNDGLTDRGLAVLEIRQGGLAVIDRAPAAFISPGM